MESLYHRNVGRKRPVFSRVQYVGSMGFPARRRWLRPFIVQVYRIERVGRSR
jgi:hypothetical protein